MAKVKVPSLTLTRDQLTSNTLYARWTHPGKKSGRWQKKIVNGKKKKTLVDALAGYTVTWTVNHPTYYTNKDGKRVTKIVTIKESSSDVGKDITSASFSIPNDATYIKCTVTPKSTKYKNKKKKDKSYFTGVGVPKSYDPTGVPEKAPTPSVSIENGKVKVVISGVPNIVSNAKIEIVRDNTTPAWHTADNVAVKTGYASYTKAVDPGHSYKARIRISGTGYTLSDWSDYSENVESDPEPLTSLTLRATSASSVNATWPSAGNDVQYELEWFSKPKVSDPERFDTTSTVSSQTCSTNEWNVTGLEAGTWYFRIRVVNNNAKSSWFPANDTDKYITLGKPPSPPTTYSLRSSIKVGEIIDLYWIHNSEDGAAQTHGEIELVFKDTTIGTITERIIKTNDKYGNPDEEDENLFYRLDTSKSHSGINVDTEESFTIDFKDGVSIEWRVRTKGPSSAGDSQGWSDWSVVRQIDIWAEPFINMLATATLGEWMWDPFNFLQDTIYTAPRAPLAPDEDDIFTTIPVGVRLTSGPLNQTPTGYSITVEAKNGYTYENEFGDTVIVNAGETIFSKYLVTDRHEFIYMLTPSNISFQDGETYIIKATVTMNSGLTAVTDEYEFTVDWEEVDMHPDADIVVDPNYLYATIVPYCTSSAIGYDIPEDAQDGDDIDVDDEEDDSNLVKDVLLAVYRKDVDGELVEIQRDIPNDRKTSIVDPHPTLDEVVYRIIAYKTDTGQIAYDDTIPEDVPQTGIVITWDESWFNTPEEMNQSEENEDEAEMDELEYSGSILKLPFNVTIDESRSPDVSLINYIGRKRPVGYYGTQLGETSTWKTEIPRVSTSDEYFSEIMPYPDEVMRLIRKLAIYTGDVYVRESEGRTGYWANVKVSFNVGYNTKVIPIAFNITRVEGGA